MSALLNSTQLRGLNHAGNAYIPGDDDDYPSFERSGCASDADRVVSYVPESDFGDLKLLLTILGILPGWIVALKLRILEWCWEQNLLPFAVLRQMRLGLRGIVFSLYYASPSIHQKIGFSVKVAPVDTI